MKFIRKGGKIIPLREKKDGNVDKRHVSNKMVAEAAVNKKTDVKKTLVGAAAGGATFGLATMTEKASYAVKKGVVAPTKKKVVSKMAVALGALLGGTIGNAMGTFTTKKEVANKLKKKAIKK